ncbi:choice-of-anchor M domain-containing protein [Micromonospora sp. NBC_01796]|uniref:choice-of-anchor M domain-containing protein n=1 Tax=Micromonospora sp. NBC_01796 TaxID=2975987 RepID=UPI002DDC830B|nr:choice-of-anchor M domain-containing protein [Micromonospora sp. NBC_01796]WSA82826.1 choice-of-anchor M domain-containing protein [Micromonospora sp. NBC_01796]
MTKGIIRDHPRRLAASVAVILAAVLLAPSPADADDRRGQTLDPNQREAAGRVVLDSGHVDIGPHYRDGTWTVRVHDDTVVPSVWRQPSEAVIRVRDTAVLPIPDDPAYAFLGQRPGTPVYVVPQTQNRDVVWVGWNTQDPGVMDTIQRGVTMKLTGVHGPGSLIVYLQSGNLGAPQVLWDSTKTLPQDLWVDTNTHTHANWVFGGPGVYLVALEITADLADDRPLTGTGVLRFAVGDTTGTDEAFTAGYPASGTPAGGDTTPAPGTAPIPAPASDAKAGPSLDGDGPDPAILTTVVITVAGLALVAAAILVLVRGRRAKRRAEAERSATVPTAEAGGER